MDKYAKAVLVALTFLVGCSGTGVDQTKPQQEDHLSEFELLLSSEFLVFIDPDRTEVSGERELSAFERVKI